jgi:hypothetical protein
MLYLPDSDQVRGWSRDDSGRSSLSMSRGWAGLRSMSVSREKEKSKEGGVGTRPGVHATATGQSRMTQP